MKIRPEGAEFFLAKGETEGRTETEGDEAKHRFSLYFITRLKGYFERK